MVIILKMLPYSCIGLVFYASVLHFNFVCIASYSTWTVSSNVVSLASGSMSRVISESFATLQPSPTNLYSFVALILITLEAWRKKANHHHTNSSIIHY